MAPLDPVPLDPVLSEVGYHRAMAGIPIVALEIFYLSLLGLAMLAIFGVSFVVIRNLFRGQR